MDESAIVAILLGTCGFPLLCLGRARVLLLSGDLPGVFRLTRIARVWCAGLIGGGAAIAAVLLWRRPESLGQLEVVAALSAPVPIWFWAMSVCARAREKQDEAARAAAATAPITIG